MPRAIAAAAKLVCGACIWLTVGKVPTAGSNPT